MPVLKVILPVGRALPGTLSGFSSVTGLRDFGPIPVLGRGANRNQTQENGDTPVGRYEVTGVKAANTDAQGLTQYGPNPRIKLKGISGNAKARDDAAGGDALLRIHGGRQSSNKKVLVATYGCLRVYDYDALELLKYLKANVVAYPLALEVAEGSVPEYAGLVVDLTSMDAAKDSP